ncbi:MAG TPA: sortase [Candidatus Saccharimonadales bacterium]
MDPIRRPKKPKFVPRPPARIVDRSRLVSEFRTPQAPRRPTSYDTDVLPPNKVVPQKHSVPAKSVNEPDLTVIKPQPYARPAEPRQQATQVLRRESVMQTVVAPPQPEAPLYVGLPFEPPKKRGKLQFAMLALACLVIGFGVFATVQTLQTNQNAKTQVTALVKTAETKSNTPDPTVPDESKPQTANYRVAANLPKYIKIPNLNVDARIVGLGVTTSNELKTPTNIYDTGWYNASAKPGDPATAGAMLIDGHVHGPTLPGVFVGLVKLKPGDTIQIVRGDDKVFNYSVVTVQNYDTAKLDMSSALKSVQPGTPGLNLITCGGSYDKTSGEYRQRTLVSAVQKL